MNIDMTAFHQTFFEESADLLEDMEARLLQLEDHADDPELLNTIFRCAHSIKGGSATFGFMDIAHFTHGLETLLDKLRNGQLHVTHSLTQVLLESQDQLKALLAVARGHSDAAPDSTELVARIEAAINGKETPQSEDAPAGNASPVNASSVNASSVNASSVNASAAGSDAPESALEEPVFGIFESSVRRYHLRLAPDPDVLQHGSDPLRLLAQLAEAGEILNVSCDVSRLPPLAEMSAEACYLAWDIDFRSDWEQERILEIFEFIADESEIVLTMEAYMEDSDSSSEFSESAVKASDSLPAPLSLLEADMAAPASTDATQAGQSLTEKKENAGAAAVITAEALPQTVVAPPKAARPAPAAATNAGKGAETATLRVATDKVDKLINLVGELIINQSMLNEVAQNFSMERMPRLLEAVSEMERACRELQERVMAVRMLPIKHAFGRFPRLVHDLSVACGKKIELKTTGEETELDKSLIEAIADPLTHLIRNSVDHGLETPEDRRAAGKPEMGTVALHAFHEGGCIVIEVSDDGRGLNRERILRKAYERGLLSESDPPPADEAIYNLIFHPGLSTAAKVTDLSGRGVGMDIVKQAVQGMGGSITLTSAPGKGTRFRVRLPLTMAILEGLSLAVGSEVYILPLTSIVESIRPKPGDVRRIAGAAEVVLVRGEALTILRLYQVFGATPVITEPTQGLLVIVENDGKRVALLVDELIGQSQVVIKSLETNYRKVDGIAGATILGDGRVALIVDVPGLIRGSRSSYSQYAA